MTGRCRRVLMTADTVGGVWTYALELARGLTARGSSVLLAVVGPGPDPAQEAEAQAVGGLDLVTTGLELEWQDRAGPLDDAACGVLLELEAGFRPDIVHCNGFREAAAGFAAPVVLAAHSCVYTWWTACRPTPLEAAWAPYAEGVRAGLDAADTVIAPSEAFLAEFMATWGRVRAPRAIANGIDLDVAPAPARRPVILAAGRLWDEAKNIAALAGIARHLPWPVLLAGEPARGAGIAANEAVGVRCLGRLPRPELHRLMAEAEILVAPARYEPFGLAVLEAARCGCALVLGRTASLCETWDGAARFVDPGDPEELRRVLLELIGDEAQRRELGRAARDRSLALGRDRMVEAYLGLYGRLLAGSWPAPEGRAA